MPSVLNSTESGSRPAGAPANAAAVTVLPPRSHDRRDRQAPQREPGRPAVLTGAGLAVVLVGVLLPMVDFFIVNVALPTIDRDLHASAPLLELVVSGVRDRLRPAAGCSAAGSATASAASACS